MGRVLSGNTVIGVTADVNVENFRNAEDPRSGWGICQARRNNLRLRVCKREAVISGTAAKVIAMDRVVFKVIHWECLLISRILKKAR